MTPSGIGRSAFAGCSEPFQALRVPKNRVAGDLLETNHYHGLGEVSNLPPNCKAVVSWGEPPHSGFLTL